jgi:hypothetical protein
MRLLTRCTVVLGVIGLSFVSEARGQTELYRVPEARGVVVFRSTDPLPVQSATPMIDPSPTGSTTTYYQAAPPVVIETLPAETTVYSPVVPAVTATEWTPVAAPTAVTVHSPIVTAPPVVVPSVPTTTYYAPAPAVGQVVYPAVPAPIAATTVYRPTVTYQPVVVPAPAVVAPAPAVAVPVGPQVTVRPKVYVQGQPIRNFFRAITP